VNRKERRRRLKEAQKQQRGTGVAVPLSAEVMRDAVDAGVVEPQPQVLRPTPKREQQVMVQAQMMSYSGPLPHPAILRGFNDIVPGSADRIIAQFEEQGRHRRKQESRVISHNLFSSTLGQVLAFILFMTLAVGGGWLIHDGKSLEGSGAIVTGIGAAIWALHGARKEKQRDLEEKRAAGKTVARRR
jgi:uncharacterized membrane protein